MTRGPRPRPRTLAAALPLAAALSAAPARAEPPSPAGAPPSDEEVTRRIDHIQTRLDLGTPAAQRWWYGWYAGWLSLTTAQAVIATATTDKGLRADAAVGAAASSLGVIPLGLFPFQPSYAAAALRRVPGATQEQRRAKLARAERLLAASAKTEALGRSWVSHVLGATVSVAGGLVLWFAYDRRATAVLNATAGIALCEIQIWTQPTRAIDDWRDYESRWNRPQNKAEARPPAVTWSLSPAPGGAGLLGTF